MMRLPAFQVLSGQTIELPGDGLLAEVLYVETDDTWTTLHVRVPVPKAHPVVVAADPFKGLETELEGWAGA